MTTLPGYRQNWHQAGCHVEPRPLCLSRRTATPAARTTGGSNAPAKPGRIRRPKRDPGGRTAIEACHCRRSCWQPDPAWTAWGWQNNPGPDHYKPHTGPFQQPECGARRGQRPPPRSGRSPASVRRPGPCSQHQPPPPGPHPHSRGGTRGYWDAKAPAQKVDP